MTTHIEVSSQHRKAARLFGIFFILTFLSYGLGSALIQSIVGEPDFLSAAHSNQSTIVIGAVLMAIIHTFTNISLPVIMLPILTPFNKRLAFGYLAAAIAATIVLVIGAIFLLLLIPLSESFVAAATVPAPYFETVGHLLKSGGIYAYYIGMTLWSLGGLMFCVVLYQSKLIPRAMSVWGIIGYFVLAFGSISELFEHNDMVEILSVIPGGLFEITLSVWLIVKGFNSTHRVINKQRLSGYRMLAKNDS
ncbi:MAG: hypothetical protein ACI9I4_002137 [Neolewinella sp.]|jgi:hypothetical protein